MGADYQPCRINRNKDVLKSECELLSHFVETGAKVSSRLGEDYQQVCRKRNEGVVCSRVDVDYQQLCRNWNEKVLVFKSGCGLSNMLSKPE